MGHSSRALKELSSRLARHSFYKYPGTNTSTPMNSGFESNFKAAKLKARMTFTFPVGVIYTVLLPTSLSKHLSTEHPNTTISNRYKHLHLHLPELNQKANTIHHPQVTRNQLTRNQQPKSTAPTAPPLPLAPAGPRLHLLHFPSQPILTPLPSSSLTCPSTTLRLPADRAAKYAARTTCYVFVAETV